MRESDELKQQRWHKLPKTTQNYPKLPKIYLKERENTSIREGGQDHFRYAKASNIEATNATIKEDVR